MQRRTAQHYRVGAQSQCLDDIGAATETAIDNHGDTLAHGIDYAWQRQYRGGCGIQHAPTVIGQHHSVRAAVRCEHSVTRVLYAFDNQLVRPQLAQFTHVVPGNAGVGSRRAAHRQGGDLGLRFGRKILVARRAGGEHVARPHAKQPARMRQYIDHVAAGEPERNGHAIAQIVFAPRRHRRIDGEYQGLESGRLGACDDLM